MTGNYVQTTYEHATISRRRSTKLFWILDYKYNNNYYYVELYNYKTYFSWMPLFISAEDSLLDSEYE